MTVMKIGSMCINGKVVAGFVVIGLGIWAIAPTLVGAAVPLLLLAVCPLSMFFMMRGMGGMGGGQSVTQPVQTSQPTRVIGTPEEQLAELKARHEAIAAEIAQLETANDTPRTQKLATVATHRMSSN